ncbi:hypothetical protein HYX05_01020 [Candidatus Woesearchaeota archaeon]|nr:hypothetical protein [Candidatus Woesearchaeota archaeon]
MINGGQKILKSSLKSQSIGINMIIFAAIGLAVLVISIFFIGRGTSEAKSNLDVFQTCKGQNGECKQSCSEGEIAHFKALGCGSGDYKVKEYCCLPR